jgi:hypothetical protein
VGDVTVRIVGGTKAVRIERPRGVPIRMHIQGGVSQVEVDGKTLGAKGGDVVVDTTGASAARDRYTLEIVGGSKSVVAVERSA